MFFGDLLTMASSKADLRALRDKQKVTLGTGSHSGTLIKVVYFLLDIHIIAANAWTLFCGSARALVPGKCFCRRIPVAISLRPQVVIMKVDCSGVEA